ncbi:hypothetical protein Moror_15698 [Moniliophthora roreri MCA 2997]|uniref:Uncharacterized protein n=2 Tax=Moniliophthora roreri TaxID=221103 RepID=V2Y073_MONRO|nr:hypothetical protein Moror_15698 [Moniliophthora roreri MCA 2997]
MSNQASSSSNLHSRPLPSPPTHVEDPEQVHYTGPFCPSPFELLYLVNTGEHDDALRLGTAASPVHRITVDGLIRLREQCTALDHIIQETNMYLANLAYNATAGAAGGLVLQGPVMVPSLRMFAMQIQTAPNFGWHMQPMPNEFGTLPNWRANNMRESPPSPHPALVYLGHLFEPDNQPAFIPSIESPPPLQVLPPSSIQTPQAPLATTPPMTDPSSSNVFLLPNQVVPPFWDDEDLVEASSSEPSSSPTDSEDMTNEVFKYLSALCAEWRTTAAKNARATVVKYAGRLRLVTSLEIVVSNDGREELLETTLPSAHCLLEMISMGVTPTPSSMETESSNSTTAATENAEEQYEWVYTGRQESFREVTLSDGTVARLEFRP